MPLFPCDSSYINISPAHYSKLLEFDKQVLESKAFHEDIEALHARFKEIYGSMLQWHGLMARAAEFRFEDDEDYSLHYNIIFNGLLPDQKERPMDSDGSYAILGCGESQSPEMRREKSSQFPLGFERLVKVCTNKDDVYRALISPGKQAEWHFTYNELVSDEGITLDQINAENIVEEAKTYLTEESVSGFRKIGHYGFLKFVQNRRSAIDVRFSPLSIRDKRKSNRQTAWDTILSATPKLPVIK